MLSGLAAMSIDLSLASIPTMVVDFATGLSTGQQIVAVLMLGFSLGQIPMGLLSDRFGRLPVLFGGLGLFLAAGIVCAAASSIEMMLGARLVQGVGAAAGVVVPRAIVRDVASGAEAGRLMSVIVMIFTVIPMFAPILGAFLVASSGWRAPFVAIVVVGALLAVAARMKVPETHAPVREHHFMRQLRDSVVEFFGHRQCRFGAMLVMFVGAGFLAMIAASSTLVIQVYGFSVESFGFIFALTGVSILCGSGLNRVLLKRFDPLAMAGVGASLIGIAAVQMLVIAWLGEVAFSWIWGCMCLYMFGNGILLPNATVLSIDPVPRIAGFAASIIGTLQTFCGAAGGFLSGLLYDGTSRNVAVIMGVCGSLTLLVYLLRSLIMGPITGQPRISSE